MLVRIIAPTLLDAKLTWRAPTLCSGSGCRASHRAPLRVSRPIRASIHGPAGLSRLRPLSGLRAPLALIGGQLALASMCDRQLPAPAAPTPDEQLAHLLPTVRAAPGGRNRPAQPALGRAPWTRRGRPAIRQARPPLDRTASPTPGDRWSYQLSPTATATGSAARWLWIRRGRPREPHGGRLAASHPPGRRPGPGAPLTGLAGPSARSSGLGRAGRPLSALEPAPRRRREQGAFAA